MSQNESGDKITIINIEPHSVASERLIPLNELGIDIGKLPKEIVSFLKQPVFPAGSLNPFMRVRRKLENDLLRVSERSRLGWVPDPTKAGDMVQTVQTAQTEYHKEAKKFAAKTAVLQQEVLDAFRDKFKEYPNIDELAVAIQAHMPTREYLEKQIRLDYFVVQVTDCEEIAGESALAQIKGGVFTALINSVVEKAEGVMEHFFDKEEIKRRTLQSLVDLGDKIKGLAFVSPKAAKLAKGYEAVMSTIPPGNDSVPVDQLGKLAAMLSLLSNAKRLRAKLDEEGDFDVTGLKVGAFANPSATGVQGPATVASISSVTSSGHRRYSVPGATESSAQQQPEEKSKGSRRRSYAASNVSQGALAL